MLHNKSYIHTLGVCNFQCFSTATIVTRTHLLRYTLSTLPVLTPASLRTERCAPSLGNRCSAKVLQLTRAVWWWSTGWRHVASSDVIPREPPHTENASAYDRMDGFRSSARWWPVAYRGGGCGVQTPSKFRRPSKIVPNSTRLWKLLTFSEFRTPTPQDVQKKGSKTTAGSQLFYISNDK